MTESYTLKFENGGERETNITFFIAEALDDPEARVFSADGEEVTDISDLSPVSEVSFPNASVEEETEDDEVSA